MINTQQKLHSADSMSVLSYSVAVDVSPANLVGSSDATRALRSSVARAAAAQPVRALVFGEHGTGRKNVAAAIHCDSADERGLSVIDCRTAAARHALQTYMCQPSWGRSARSLLIEGPEQLDISQQNELAHWLLRAGCQEASGGFVPISVFATIRNSISELVHKGELSAVLVEAFESLVFIPPLRDREGDIEQLAQRFVDAMNSEFNKRCAISPELLRSYRTYDWPGNVRELKRITAALFHSTEDDGELKPREDRAPELFAQSRCCVRSLVGRRLEDVKRELFLATLSHHRGNRRKAADTLGISLKTLYNRLRDYDVEG